MTTSGLAVPSWGGVAASLLLVAVADAVAYRQQLRLTRDIIVAAARAGVQLVAVGAIQPLMQVLAARGGCRLLPASFAFSPSAATRQQIRHRE